jgi:hypothetical protein
MHFIIEIFFESVPRALGWAVLKVVSLGRYRGFGPTDVVVEGAVGLGAFALLCAAAYMWWPSVP